MPDRISYFTNAWESTAPSGFSDIAATLTVADAAALQVPCYIVIDPDVPASREFVWVASKNGNDLSVTERNLAGSAGQVTHAADALVRSVATAQAFTDLHLRISQNTTDITANDPAGVYLPLAGGTMAGALNMNSLQITNLPTPTLDGHAARKLYVDDEITTLGTSLSAEIDADIAAHVALGDPHVQYLTEAAASSTYLTQANAASTYLTQANASATYLPLAGGTITGALTVAAPLTVNGDGSVFATFGPEGTSNLVIDDFLAAGNDFRIQNDNQGNGIVFRDGTGGVELLYAGLDKLSVVSTGVEITGTLSVSSDPTAANEVGDRAYNDGRYLQLTGGTMTGDLAMSADIDFTGTGNTREIRWDSDTSIYSSGDGIINIRANGQLQVQVTTSGTTINDLLTASAITLDSGSASAPSLRFDASPNSGLYYASPGPRMVDDGSVIMYWAKDAGGASNVYIPNIPDGGVSETVRYNTVNDLLSINTSTARHKENIVDMPLAQAKKILNVRVARYTRISDPDGPPEYGMIAEEAIGHIPEVVMKDKQNQPFSVVKDGLVPHIIKLLQDHEARLQGAGL